MFEPIETFTKIENRARFPVELLLLLFFEMDAFAKMMNPESRSNLDIEPKPWMCPICNSDRFRFTNPRGLRTHHRPLLVIPVPLSKVFQILQNVITYSENL